MRSLELLEERIVLDGGLFVLGPLALSGNFIQDSVDPEKYTATGLTPVMLGLAPTGSAEFQSLLTITPTSADASVSFIMGTDDPQFTVSDVSFDATIQGVPDLELWKSTASTVFNATALATTGVQFTTGTDEPFPIDSGTFTADNIRFDNVAIPGTSAPQIKLQGAITQNTFAGLDMAVVGSNFLILSSSGEDVTGVDSAVSGSLSVGNVGFSIKDLAAHYDGTEFSLTGTTTLMVGSDINVSASFIGEGLRIRQGIVQALNLSLTSDLHIDGLDFTTSNLTIGYTNLPPTFTLTGSASLTVSKQSLQVTFGEGGAPGLVIANGELQTFQVAVESSFSLLGLQVDVGVAGSPVVIRDDVDNNSVELSGTVTVDTLFGASVTFGSLSQPGLVIDSDGNFVLDRVSLSLTDIPLGAFTITNLTVAYTTSSFSASLWLWFPEGWNVGGSVVFENDELKSIGVALRADQSSGIAVGDTGVFITGFSGEVQNLDNPENLVVSGSLEASWGTKSLFSAEGTFLVDQNELDLSASVKFLDGFSTGSGELVLDWGTQTYTLDVQAVWDEIFTFNLQINLSGGGNDLYIKARAAVTMPDQIPFIGGDTFADIDFVLEYHANESLSQSFVAAWVHVNLELTSFDIGVKVDFEGDVSVIGGIGGPPVNPPPPHNNMPQIWIYTFPFSVPANTTQATVLVNWPEAGGMQSVKIIPPSGTAPSVTNVAQFTSDQSDMERISGSSTDPYQPLTPGLYLLQLTSTYHFSSPPVLTPSYSNALPTIAVGSLPPNPTQSQVSVPLTGKVVSSLGSSAHASLFLDTDNSGYNGSPIPNASYLPISVNADGTWSVDPTWNLSGLAPLPYYVYAQINDGLNPPVYSAYSTAVTPMPALIGNVTNAMNHQGLSGFTVYIDTDHGGQFDPHDHYITTGPSGFYSFPAADLPTTKFYIGVVIPNGYQIDPTSTNPVVVPDGYSGKALNADFGIDEFAAIQGSVSESISSGSQPLNGWTVYLDSNGNGMLDPGERSTITDSSGDYSFHNLTLNSTQIVSLQLQPGFYQTAPAAPGTYSVMVSGNRFQLYPNNNFSVLPFSTVAGTISGYGLNDGTLNPNTTPMASVPVALTTPTIAIDAGGSAAGPYLGDQGFSGGNAGQRSTANIDTSRIADAAPQAVYQTSRQGQAFNYTINDLVPNATYIVRLHFAETQWTAAGQRLFNVSINGQQELTNFDIFAAAGGGNIAYAQSFTVQANASGVIQVKFAAGKDNAQVNGIEVNQIVARTVTDANGHYSFGNLKAGNYSVIQMQPDNYRQIAPFISDLRLLAPPNILQTFSFSDIQATPISTAVADFDGNGKQDIAVQLNTAFGSVGMNIYFNGDLVDFLPVILEPSYSGTPVKIVAADVLGNGRPDIAILFTDGTVEVFRNDGSRQFTDLGVVYSTTNVTAYDMVMGRFVAGDDVDQLAIIASSGGLVSTVLVDYMANGVASSANLYVQSFVPTPQTIVAADVNHDGWDDVLLGYAGQSPLLVFGNALNQDVTLTGLPAGAVTFAGDINGDGNADLGSFDQSSQTFTYAIQNAAGSFTYYSSTVGAGGATIEDALLVDVNGDLKPDLVWVSQNSAGSTLSVDLNSGMDGAWFTPAQQSQWALAPSPGGGRVLLNAGQINGDPLNDLVVIDRANVTVEVIYNRSITNPSPINISVDGIDAIAEDFVNVQLGQINGRAFEDVSRDGVNQLVEPGEAGLTVFLDTNGNGRLDAGERSTMTGADGYYAFAGLPDGTYRVRVVPRQGRKLTTPAGDSYTVTIGSSTPAALELNFGSVVGLDVSLTIPASAGTGVWTVERSGDRLEVVDSQIGVVFSQLLADVNSLTISGSSARPTSLTIRMLAGGFFSLPGGVSFHGVNSTMRFVLGANNDTVSIDNGTANIGSGSRVGWDGVAALTIDTGAGDDRVTLRSTSASGPSFTINGGNGNDTVLIKEIASPLIVNGNAGNDSLTVASDPALIRVPVTLSGGRGDDALKGGPRDDLLIWNNGDGSDHIEGGGGDDTLQVQTSLTGADRVAIGPAGARVSVHVFSPQTAILDLGAIENIDVNTGGGDDLIQVTPLASTAVNVNGGSGFNTIVVQTKGAGQPQFGYQGPLAGRWTFSSAMPVTFSNITSFTAPQSVVYVLNLYRTTLGREPRASELNALISSLDAGATRTDLAESVWRSPEHRGQEVDQLYATYLHRPADPASRNYWVNALLRGVSETTVARSLLASPAYRAAHPSNASYVAGLYQDVLGREATRQETVRWVTAASRGLGRAGLAQRFLTSKPALEQLVGNDYESILGRAETPRELRFWTSQLRSRRASPSSIAERFLGSDEFQARFQRNVAAATR